MACTRRTIFLLLVIHTIRDVHARVMTMRSYLACHLSPLMIYIRASPTMTSSPKLPALSMQLHLGACHAPLRYATQNNELPIHHDRNKNINIYMNIYTYVGMRGCICFCRYVYEYKKNWNMYIYVHVYVCICINILCIYAHVYERRTDSLCFTWKT